MFGSRRSLVIVLLLAAPLLPACGDDAPSTPGDPLTQGLLAYYPFQGNVNDESGAGNHGLLLGGASVQDGALVAGSNDTDALSLPASVMNGRGNFGVSGWVRMDTFHQYASQWISCATAAESNNLGLYYNSNSQRWGIDILSDRLDFPVNAAMDDHDWHLITLSRNADTASLYVDRMFVGSLAVPAAVLTVDPGGFIVGQDQDSLGGGFSTDNSLAGAADDLRIYDRALDADDVALIHSVGRSTPTTD